jgi:AP-5 complex subunit beta-1
VLFKIVSRSNGAFDAVLRATACDCIAELEQLYPGMFHTIAGNLLVFAQTETSFAHSAYTSLFVTVIIFSISPKMRAKTRIKLSKRRGNVWRQHGLGTF